MKRRAAIVLNPAAGRRTGDDARLREWLAPHFVLDVHTTRKDFDANDCARAALAAQPDLVIAAGGDGTVSMVAGALVGTAIPLAILAYGTSNSIAGGLGIPTDEAGAVETIVTGEARCIDSARANGQPMVLHASLGFHAATVAGTPRDAKNRWGLVSYITEGLVRLADLQPFDVEIETEDQILRCQAVNVTAANVAPPKTLLAQGPAVVSPKDGELDVTIVSAANLAEVIATGLHLARTATLGLPATRDNVGFFSARRLRIDAEPPQPLLVDGEPAGTGRLTLECVPRSLLVMLPREHEIPHPPGDEKLEGLPRLEVTPKS